MMGSPMASPSPNSRGSGGSFNSPSTKNRVIVGGPGQNIAAFQHPVAMSRPVSVQIPRPGQIAQRITQSPYSPQTPQSPHDQFPLSPATQPGVDPFSRPPSENSQQDPYVNVRHSILFYFLFTKTQYFIFIYFFHFSHHKHHVHLVIKVQILHRIVVQPMLANQIK